MSLLIAKTTFDAQLSQHLKDFFYNNANSIYYVDPYDEDGNLLTEEEIRSIGESKINLFSQNIGNIIYNFIKEASVNPGIAVTTSSGSGSTVGTGTIS